MSFFEGSVIESHSFCCCTFVELLLDLVVFTVLFQTAGVETARSSCVEKSMAYCGFGVSKEGEPAVRLICLACA